MRKTEGRSIPAQGSTSQTKQPTIEETPPTETSEDEFLTPQEVAERCRLSRRRVYDWLAWGWLRGHRRGGRWVVTIEDWEFFTRTCRGARGRLMPSLRDWEPIWQTRPDKASCI